MTRFLAAAILSLSVLAGVSAASAIPGSPYNNLPGWAQDAFHTND